MRLRLACPVLVLALAIGASAHCGPLDQVSAPLRQAARCMLGVLEAVPDIRSPALGVQDVNGEARPVVSYAYSNREGETFTVRFVGGVLNGAYLFTTGLPGLAPAGRSPDDAKTTELGRLWKRRCGVVAAVFYD